MPNDPQQALSTGVAVGVVLTVLVFGIWCHFPYPGQLLLVLVILGAVAGGVVKVLRGLSAESAELLGRVITGVACVVLFVPFVGLLMRVLRAAFRG